MGGVESKKEKIQRYNKIKANKWEKTGQEGITQFAIDQNGREGQINIIKLDPTRKVQDELEVYYYRRTFQGPIVKCYGAQSLNNQSPGICGVNKTMKVITQRIIKRWYQLPQLTFPESLYALDQALQGYKVLYGQVGPFQVNHNMLGINKKGELHVWLNQNFADNNPSLQRGVLYTTTNVENLLGTNNQVDMIDNIYRVIQQKCQTGQFPANFAGEFSKNRQNFNKAGEFIDDYIIRNRLEVPDKIHPDSKLMYVSKTKGIPLVSNIKSTTSDYTYKWNQTPNNNSNNSSSYKNTIIENSITRSPGNVLKNQEIRAQGGSESKDKDNRLFSLNNQTIFNTTYIDNKNNIGSKQQPKYVTFGSNQAVNNGTPQNSFGYQTGGYQTGGFQTSPSKEKNDWQTKNYESLRHNQNIDVVESSYKAKQSNPPSWIRDTVPADKITTSGVVNTDLSKNIVPVTLTYNTNANTATNTNTNKNSDFGYNDSFKVGNFIIPGSANTSSYSYNTLKKDIVTDFALPKDNVYISNNLNNKQLTGGFTNNTGNTYSYKQIVTTTTNTYGAPPSFNKANITFNYGSSPEKQITNTYTTANNTSDTTKDIIGTKNSSNPAITGTSSNTVTYTTTSYGPTTTFNKDVYSANKEYNNGIETSQVTKQF